MARTIAVANQKGGVGKTTTSVNLAAAMATMHKRVLLVDLDPQGNATMGSGIDKYSLEQAMYEILIENVPVKDVIQRPLDDSAWVLPANADLTAAEVELMDRPNREKCLINALAPVANDFDYIIIDCPPSLNILTLNAFVASDSVLIPIQCEYYALEGLSALLGTIEDVRAAVNPTLEIEGLLRTMFDSRNNLGNEVSAQLEHHFGDQVFRTIVPRNVRVAEAPSHGVSIVHYDKTSRGALAYLALAGEIVRQHAQHRSPATEANPAVAEAEQAVTSEKSDEADNFQVRSSDSIDMAADEIDHDSTHDTTLELTPDLSADIAREEIN